MFKTGPNTTAEEFITYLHIAISHSPAGPIRDGLIKAMCELKEDILFLETCYHCSSYEPKRSNRLHRNSQGEVDNG